MLSVSRIQAVVGAALADAKIQHLRIRGEWVVNEHLSEFGGFTLLGLRAADSVIKAPFDDVARSSSQLYYYSCTTPGAVTCGCAS